MVLTDNAPNLRNIHALVLDDHQDTLEVFRTALESCMANVLTARTARDAVTILKTVRLDAIISDLAMPGEDGYSLIDKIRTLETGTGKHIPAIALTAYVRVEDRTRALSAGFNLFVPKPVQPYELVAAIVNLTELA